ncbi:MAG: hypothetical protein PHR25_02960 [Clostridia bacterium]|nr:hypothetical protein [Clostridia bacterium]
MKNKGISLIVLVITIIVIIVLATTIILTLSGSNIIGKAKLAVERSDSRNISKAVELYFAENMGTDVKPYLSEVSTQDILSNTTLRDTIITDVGGLIGKFYKLDMNLIKSNVEKGKGINGEDDYYIYSDKTGNVYYMKNPISLTKDKPNSIPESGDGTLSNPYTIVTAEDLYNVRNDLNGSYIQVADIDLSSYSSGEGWEPIGTNYNNPFKGNYDGGRNKIINLTINRPNSDYQGLFGYCYEDDYNKNKKIKNVIIENAKIIGKNYVGAIAGNSEISIINSSSTGNITGNQNVGGIIGVGYNVAIDNCYSAGSVNGLNYVGGIAGSFSGYDFGSLKNSYSTSSIKGKSYVAGIVGITGEGTQIRNVFALNDSITRSEGSDNNVSRVLCEEGEEYQSQKSGIYANQEMLFKQGSSQGTTNFPNQNKTLSGKDGLNISLEACKQKETFSSIGWDFENIWNIANGSTYPTFLPVKGMESFNIKGKGTINDPYLISNAEELNYIRYGLNKNYKQTANIDLTNYSSGAGWLPIGDSTEKFTGVYDGAGYKITNLNINRPEEYNIGLFGLTYEATLKNIRMENVKVTAKGTVGGLAGNTYETKIQRTSVSGEVNAIDYGTSGILVGYANSNYQTDKAVIEECYTEGKVTGYECGGLGRIYYRNTKKLLFKGKCSCNRFWRWTSR